MNFIGARGAAGPIPAMDHDGASERVRRSIAAAYLALLQPSQNVAPFTYSSVATNLFDDIATSKIAAGPRPAGEQRAGAVHPAGGAH